MKKKAEPADDGALDIDALSGEIVDRIGRVTRRTTGAARDLRKEFSKRIKDAPARDVVQLALTLMDGPEWERRIIAYELILHHRAALASLREADLEALGRGLDSWWSVDIFACYLSGPAWRERQISDRVIKRWARSSDRWWRRSAVVSTIALNNKARGGRGDVERTLWACEMLLDDRDDMIEKAISWSLRELAKREPEVVRDFMKEHEERLAARVKREVRHKLETGVKNPRKNKKV